MRDVKEEHSLVLVFRPACVCVHHIPRGVGDVMVNPQASGYLLQRAELLADSAVALVKEQERHRDSSAASISSISNQEEKEEEETGGGGRGGRNNSSEPHGIRTMPPNLTSPQVALQPIAECPTWRERGRARSDSITSEAPIPQVGASSQRSPPASPYSTTKLLRPRGTTPSDAAVEVKQRRSMLASLRSVLSKATINSTHC